MKKKKWVPGLALAINEDLSGVLGLAPAKYGKRWVLGLALAIVVSAVFELVLREKRLTSCTCPDKW